jgi:hypothetical protein
MGESKGDKSAMLMQLKDLLSQTGSNGQAERQLAIDQLIYKINELGE